MDGQLRSVDDENIAPEAMASVRFASYKLPSSTH